MFLWLKEKKKHQHFFILWIVKYQCKTKLWGWRLIDWRFLKTFPSLHRAVFSFTFSHRSYPQPPPLTSFNPFSVSPCRKIWNGKKKKNPLSAASWQYLSVNNFCWSTSGVNDHGIITAKCPDTGHPWATLPPGWQLWRRVDFSCHKFIKI